MTLPYTNSTVYIYTVAYCDECTHKQARNVAYCDECTHKQARNVCIRWQVIVTCPQIDYIKLLLHVHKLFT